MKTASKLFIQLLVLSCLLLPLRSYADAQGPVSDLLRQDGKLWVVITVIAVVFAGLIYYIARMNKRINGLNKK